MHAAISTQDIAEMKPLLVRASAGTGKTYQLTGRLLRILLGGASPDTIIATTFTRKAAGEIMSRVLLSLAWAAVDETEKSLKDLRAQTGLDDLSRDRCIVMTHAVLREIHRIKILTLDSFFSQLARQFSYEIGIPPGWRLIDELEEVAFKESAIDAMLASLEPTEVNTILSQLNKGDAKREVRRNLLEVIDAAYQISRGADADAWDRLPVPVEPSEGAITECMIALSQASVGHESANKLIRGLAVHVNQRTWDKMLKMTLVRDAVSLSGDDVLLCYKKVIPPEIIKAIDVVVALLKTRTLGLLRAQTQATSRVIAAYQYHVNELKQNARGFSFDDIAHQLSQSLSPVSMTQIGDRMDGMIEHLLLDEFQDTSPIQWNVLKSMATSTTQIPGGSFFCVGDTKQAIYGWRGGVAEIFDSVADQVVGVAQREQNLSFRSSPVVIESVNEIFRNLRRHPVMTSDAKKPTQSEQALKHAIQKFSASFPEHQSSRVGMAGYVTVVTSADGNDANHLRHVAERIAQSARSSPEATIGVLTRTNRAVATIIHAMRHSGITVSQEGGNPLVDSPAVEMVLSTLMMAEHPDDLRWSFHVASTPIGKWIGLTDFSKPAETASTVRGRIEADGLARLVEDVARILIPNCGTTDALRLRQLIYLAQQYEQTRGPRITHFVSLVRNKRIEKAAPAQVRVMTIHQAKGLEFDIVVVPELSKSLVNGTTGTVAMRQSVDGPATGLLRYLNQDDWPLLPDAWQKCFCDKMEANFTESLCLLYVALTRAKRWLDVIVEPEKKQSPEGKTSAALLYHALACEADARTGDTMWYESGDPTWYVKMLTVTM